ncbi:MAG: hypothetical protein AAGH79_07725 [Bacteroidota bacterium]
MLSTAYFLLFLVLVTILLWMSNLGMQNAQITSSERRKYLLMIVGSLATWILIQWIASTAGFYDNLSLPPRIPLFMIFPLFLFTIGFFYRNRTNQALHGIPIHLPIAYQSFRAVIELLFYFTFLEGILPIQVTFEGANYDVLLGLSAIGVAIYATWPSASRRLLIAWNILGIAVVGFAAFTFISSFYFPSFWGQEEVPLAFNQFPYLLLPSFFMPSAIFIHILSIVQLKTN